MHDLYIFFTPLHTTHKCELFVEVGSLNPAVTPVVLRLYTTLYEFLVISVGKKAGTIKPWCSRVEAVNFWGLFGLWVCQHHVAKSNIADGVERGKLWKTGWPQLVKNEQLNSSRPHSTDCSRLMSVSDTKNCQNGVSFKEFRSCCLETMTGWHDSFFLGGSFFGGSSLNLIIRQW